MMFPIIARPRHVLLEPTASSGLAITYSFTREKPLCPAHTAERPLITIQISLVNMGVQNFTDIRFESPGSPEAIPSVPALAPQGGTADVYAYIHFPQKTAPVKMTVM